MAPGQVNRATAYGGLRAARGPRSTRPVRRRDRRRRRRRSGDRARADAPRRLVRARRGRPRTSAPGTSKANTAILHTGFDAKPGTIESKLVARGHELLSRYAERVGIPTATTGALMVAWNAEQLEALDGIAAKAAENGYSETRAVTVEELYRREPALGQGALGALEIPGEGIVCPFTTTLALATEAVLGGCELVLGARVHDVDRAASVRRSTPRADRSRAEYLVNAAGLHSDELDAHARPRRLHRDAAPRRADRLRQARPSASSTTSCCPCPTAKTKGVLVAPTVYGNVLLGPTADDVAEQAGPLDHRRRPGLAARGRARGSCPRLVRPRGHRDLRRPAGGDRGSRLPAPRPRRAAIRLRRRHPLDRRVRVDGDRRARPRGPRRAPASACRSQPREVELRMPNIGELSPRPYQQPELMRPRPGLRPHRLLLRAGDAGRDRGGDERSDPALRPRRSEAPNPCPDGSLPGLLLRRRGRGEPQAMSAAEGVVIVGGGPSGLAAAIELRRRGVEPGDRDRARARDRRHPRHSDHTGFGASRHEAGPVRPPVRAPLRASSRPGPGSSWSPRRWSPTGRATRRLRLTGPGGRAELEPPAVVLATGCRERPRSARLVPGSRPAGVMTTSTLQQLVYLHGERVGRRAVVVGAEHVSFSAVATLAHGGASVAGLVTDLPRHQSLAVFRLGAAIRYRARLWTRTALTAIHGTEPGRGGRADRPRLGAHAKRALRPGRVHRRLDPRPRAGRDGRLRDRPRDARPARRRRDFAPRPRASSRPATSSTPRRPPTSPRSTDATSRAR